MIVSFPMTIGFRTRQAAVDFVATINEAKHTSAGKPCSCSFVRVGREVTIQPQDDDHGREIAVALIQAGVLEFTGDD